MSVRPFLYRLASQPWSGLAIAALVAGAGALARITGATFAGATLLIASAALGAGAAFQLLMSARALRRYPPPGTLVDVGGYRVHLLAEGSGGPTIVWIPGSHDGGLALHHLHRKIRGEVRSVLYDRPGSGYSDVGPFPRDLTREVAELDTALRMAGEKPPFLVVAHSLGGLLAQNFAHRNPDQVAGLVLLDSACPDAAVYVQNLPENKIIGLGLSRWLATAFGLGWIIVARMKGAQRQWLAPYEPDIQQRVIYGVCQPKLTPGFKSALESITTNPFDMVKGDGALGDLPVLVAFPPDSFEAQVADVQSRLPRFSDVQVRNFVRLRMDAQRQNARLSSRGEIVLAPPKTTHSFPQEVPDFTVGLVRRMLAQLKSESVSPTPNRPRSRPEFPSLAEELALSLEKHGVPGATVAVFSDGRVQEAAAGVVSRVSRVPATADSIFHVGSVTKLFTATRVMQLVERKAVDLDAPFRQYVPEFTLADAAAADRVTTRHLLAHRSGVPGDFFKDTGSNDDKLEKYAIACGELVPTFPSGERFSYSNAGYSLLGRLLERLEGRPWERVLADGLMEPLGIQRWAVRPQDEVRFRSAVGHAPDLRTGKPKIAALTPASMAPGGARLALSARELIRFAELYLNEGRSESGVQLLSPETVRAMWSTESDLPLNARIRAWGLGWMLFDYGGKRLVGHDGGTAGMSAYLRLIPEEKFAIALMTNGGSSGVFRDIVGGILAKRGAPLPSPSIAAPELSLDLARYAGRYLRYGMQVDIQPGDKGLRALVNSRDGEENVAEPTWMDLSPVNEGTFVVRVPGFEIPMEVYFTDFDAHGQPQYFHSQERALRRLA